MTTPTNLHGALTVLVGLPASGKSTWAKEFAGTAIIVSTDDLRQKLTGDAADQSRNGDVWRQAYETAAYWLTVGKNVIFDATNCGKRDRRNIVRTLGRCAKQINAVYFNTPLEECKRRNQKRERKVPDEVYLRMVSRLSVPTKEEGFDNVMII